MRSAWIVDCMSAYVFSQAEVSHIVTFEMSLPSLYVCKPQQALILDSQCESADINFIVRLLHACSSMTLTLLSLIQGVAWQAEREATCSPPQGFCPFWSSWVSALPYMLFSLLKQRQWFGENCETTKTRSINNVLLKLQSWCVTCTVKINFTLISRLSVRTGNQTLWSPEINLLSEVTTQLAEMCWNHGQL